MALVESLPVATAALPGPVDELVDDVESRRRFVGAVLASVLALGVSLVLAVSMGSVDVPPRRVLTVLVNELVGSGGEVDRYHQIIWQLRVPRSLLAAICGAGLAMVGVGVQALVRNPLADPYVLGISSGASVGAVAVLLFGGFAALGLWALTGAAMAGAAIATLVVYLIALRGTGLGPMRLVLTGVAVGYALSALTSLLVFLGDDRGAASVLGWLLGSLGRAQWSYVPIPLAVVGLGFAWLFARGPQIDALLVGEEAAETLGVDVPRLRSGLFLVTAAVTGSVVAVAGGIGFVGLVVPHLARLAVGVTHRRCLPVAALLGAVTVVLADLAARLLVAPQELPISVLTGLVGGPVFAWLMSRRGSGAFA